MGPPRGEFRQQCTALPALTIGTQTWYQTGPRTLLVLFPVWITLAQLDARQPWVRYVYLSVSALLAAVMGLMFLTYQWTGLASIHRPIPVDRFRSDSCTRRFPR
jgi:hypothetical protein